MQSSRWLLAAFIAITALGGCLGGDSSGPPAATHLSVTAPAMVTAGTSFEITVTALDGANNVVPGFPDTVRYSSTDGQALLPVTASLINGSATFPTTLRTAGSQTITATDTANALITGTAPAIQVSPGAVNHLSLAATTVAQSGRAFYLTVSARDAANNVASSYSGTVHLSSTDPNAVLPANSSLTDGKGTFSVTLQAAGRQTITATDTTTPSITGTFYAIEVGFGPPTHFAISAPPAASVGAAFNFAVSARDAANNPAYGYPGTVHFSSVDERATLPTNSTLTSGSGNFSATLETAGSQTLAATDAATASITGTSSAITVGPPPPFHFSVSAPSAAQSGTSINFSVTALNTANGVASNYTGTVQFSSTDAQAVLPANSALKNGVGNFSVTLQSAGSQTLTATDTVTASITGSTASIDVSPGPATQLSVLGPNAVELAQPFALIVTARDAANNLAPSYAGTVHFASADPKAVLPGDSTLSSGMGVFSATLQTTGAQSITGTDTVTASITSKSNPIDVIKGLCRTRGESCTGENSDSCCPELRCREIFGGFMGGGTYACEY